MVGHKKVCERVYQIGGSGLSHPTDCAIYLVKVSSTEFVMIDCGSGEGFEQLIKNIQSIGLKPKGVKAIFLTHCHIDHIGAALKLKNSYGCEIIAHLRDADAIQGKDKIKTAAAWYALDYKSVSIDRVIAGESDKLQIGDVEFNVLHTPGHTPGSISVYCDISGNRVLFGQDIHGPFDSSFGSSIKDWKKSMKKLLELDANILCEGHFGVYQPSNEVKQYIEGYLSKY
jgi:glyoxylase-like metal-dependent hydrolase (beta-lactamase superfamily II)